MEIAALVVSIVAAMTASAAAVYARRQAVGTIAQAVEAKRANDRLDALDAAEAEAQRRGDEARKVNWHLHQHDTHQYSLRNRGTDTARNVTLTTTGADLSGNAEVGDMAPEHPKTLVIHPDLTFENAEAPRLAIEWEGGGPQWIDLPAR